MAITPENLLTLLGQAFIQRAFIIGVIIALLSSILGVFIVLKKMSLIGDGLAHTAFGGLALGYYLNIVPLWTAAVVVILSSVGITKATRSRKISGDAAVAVFLQLGLASGIVLLSLARGFGVNIDSLLFGSILLVDFAQIITTTAILAITIIIIFIFYKELIYTAFDEVQARASGINTSFFDYLVSVLAGIVVIAAIPIVGVLLVSAMLVLPALTSLQVSKSFRQTIVISPIFGLISVILGLLLSIILETSSGATIVLTALLIFLATIATKRLLRRSKPELQNHESHPKELA